MGQQFDPLYVTTDSTENEFICPSSKTPGWNAGVEPARTHPIKYWKCHHFTLVTQSAHVWGAQQ
jgi:hypothetical protein